MKSKKVLNKITFFSQKLIFHCLKKKPKKSIFFTFSSHTEYVKRENI